MRVLLLVSGSTAMAARLSGAGGVGLMFTPNNPNATAATVRRTGLPWALDNGAYSGFDPDAFRRCLGRLAGAGGCLFAVCPDVVGDARATLARFGEWSGRVRGHGYPVAFVGQDGQESLPVPWGRLDAWFIGGSTRWKLSQASADLAAEAGRRGKWVHCGRVNSLRRLRWAFDAGCDSVDGSGYSRFEAVARRKGRRDMLLERHLALVRELRTQGVLF